MDAAAIGDNGASAGLGQWRDERRRAFRLMFGHDVAQGTPLEQAQFTQWELTHTEKAAGDHLRQTTTARAGGVVFSKEYERPKDVGMNAALRGQYADTWQQKFATMPEANIAGGTGTAPTVDHTVKGAATLKVILGGAVPPGTKTAASTSGDLFQGAPRVETSMAGVGP